jgi:predicted O-methyltransferase YrrM
MRFEEVDRYIIDAFAPEDDALKHVYEGQSTTFMPHASISPSQGKFLQLLVKMNNSKRILEIGALAGYSTIWLARALEEDGYLLSLELYQENIDLARRHCQAAALSPKVEFMQGPALESIAKLPREEKFDFVFIDADKLSYCDYFHAILPLCHKGSIIVADNVIREGKVLDTGSKNEKVHGVQRFNRMLSEHPAVDAIVLQTVGIKGHDGMAISLVK